MTETNTESVRFEDAEFESVTVLNGTASGGGFSYRTERLNAVEAKMWLQNSRSDQSPVVSRFESIDRDQSMQTEMVSGASDMAMNILLVSWPAPPEDYWIKVRTMSQWFGFPELPGESLYKNGSTRFVCRSYGQEVFHKCEFFSSSAQWIYSLSDGSSTGMVTSISNPEALFDKYFRVESELLRSILFHPMYLALVDVGGWLLAYEHYLSGDTERIIKAQRKIGYYQYAHLNPDPNADNDDIPLADLSTHVNQLAATVVERGADMKCLKDIARSLIKENLCRYSIREDFEDMAGIFNAEAEAFVQKVTLMLTDVEMWLKISTIILQGIFNLISREDQQISIRIADDSRILAQETKRDSTSMRALAGVTMAFLPGTFVASLFAMPLFQWNASASEVINNRFYIYWAVTVPLTMLTLSLWLGFAWFMNRRQETRQFSLVSRQDKKVTTTTSATYS